MNLQNAVDFQLYLKSIKQKGVGKKGREYTWNTFSRI